MRVAVSDPFAFDAWRVLADHLEAQGDPRGAVLSAWLAWSGDPDSRIRQWVGRHAETLVPDLVRAGLATSAVWRGPLPVGLRPSLDGWRPPDARLLRSSDATFVRALHLRLGSAAASRATPWLIAAATSCVELEWRGRRPSLGAWVRDVRAGALGL
ncbi:MAG: hypothetical protein KC656_27380, partial [Myxococcales bacterium]|nr:hypothetical protein [Myxococcales bacterium]